ncbi:MAG: class I SAM-dependent methyltransferase [Candidatus Kerfeldbacteria bacterium]|nr:class I SAM-dependent methyltransferase [Candidatus Kerfeldbacteria bacterium]
MTRKNDPYKQTINVYAELGDTYLRDIAHAAPQEIGQFARLIRKQGRVLDVGCAGGRDSAFFVNRRFRVIGIDLVDKFLRFARKKVPGATFKRMDVRRLRFRPNTFDAIWANAVLLHLHKKDVRQVLKKFFVILRLNGKLHLRVKQGRGQQYGQTREPLVQGKRRLFTYFQLKELVKYVTQAGFQILRSKIYPDNLGRQDVRWVSIWAEKH